jgi:uncharacterized damage-inducible protein DinB
MQSDLGAMIWRQFGAAIDTLGDAIRACPDELWTDKSLHMEYWYVAYHALFWLDLYVFGSFEGFAPPAPFGREELEPGGVLARPYSKLELLDYLAYCREKCRLALLSMSDDKASRPFKFTWSTRTMPYAELMLYTMRHVQEHAAQLAWMLGEKTGSAPDWVSRAREDRHDAA